MEKLKRLHQYLSRSENVCLYCTDIGKTQRIARSGVDLVV